MSKEALLAQQEAQAEELFNKQYYQDITKRTDMQNMFRLLEENQRNAEERAANQSAITGATPEQKLASQEITRKAYADSIADLASNASALKDSYLRDYMGRRDAFFGQKLDMISNVANLYQNDANMMGQASANMFQTGANMLGGALGGTQTTPTGAQTTPTYDPRLETYKGKFHTSPTGIGG